VNVIQKLLGLIKGEQDAPLLEVTQQDLEQGKKLHGRECPVALAARRLFERGDRVILVGVSIITVYQRRADELPYYGTPVAQWTADGLSDYIERIDTGREVTPREFRLRPA